MARKRDPIVPVLQYFESAELPLAEQALSLIKEIVRKRQPQTSRRRATTRKAKASDPTSTAGPD